jgi:hypothetical protein
MYCYVLYLICLYTFFNMIFTPRLASLEINKLLIVSLSFKTIHRNFTLILD